MSFPSRHGRVRPAVLPAALFIIVLLPTSVAALRLLDAIALLPSADWLTPTPVAKPLLALHAVGAVGFLLLGALQILPRVRARHPRWHRRAGVLAWILGMSGALSGLAATLAYPGISGPLLYWGRIAASALWLLALVWAACVLRQRSWADHGRWMLRAYALALPAATLPFLLIPFILSFGEGHQLAEEALQVLAWPLHLIVVDRIWQGRNAPPRYSAAVAPYSDLRS